MMEVLVLFAHSITEGMVDHFIGKCGFKRKTQSFGYVKTFVVDLVEIAPPDQTPSQHNSFILISRTVLFCASVTPAI